MKLDRIVYFVSVGEKWDLLSIKIDTILLLCDLQGVKRFLFPTGRLNSWL